MIEFIHSNIPEVILIKPNIFRDNRGFFLESYNQKLFAAHGINVQFVQDNHSASTKGVLRGLHYQLNPHAQGKIVRCIRGAIFDVAVDIRRNSPTFGSWVGYELNEQNAHMLWIPRGFAHGFLALDNYNEVMYKTDNFYNAQSGHGIRFDDVKIGIKWPHIDKLEFVLSDQDLKHPGLDNAQINFEY